MQARPTKNVKFKGHRILHKTEWINLLLMKNSIIVIYTS